MNWLEFLLLLAWMVGFPYQMIGLSKAPARLRDWAGRHCLRIVDRREPWSTWRGPFAGRTSSQTLYRVIFEDDRGDRRSAWALCGSPLRGSWADRVEVRWDKAGGPLLPTTPRAGRGPVGSMGLRGLLLGLGIGVVLLLSAGLIPSVAAAPLLAISAVLGAIVGGLLGIAGDAFLSRPTLHDKPRAFLDEL